MAIGNYISAAGSLLGNLGQYNTAGDVIGHAKENAANARKNSEFSKNMTLLTVLRQNRETYKVLGGARADIAASGLAASGSALDVLRSSARDAALDTSLMRMQGTINSQNWLDKAAGYDADAKAAAKKKSGGLFGAIGSILGGVAGFVVGGPAGAAAGAQIGGGVGNFAGSL